MRDTVVGCTFLSVKKLIYNQTNAVCIIILNVLSNKVTGINLVSRLKQEKVIQLKKIEST